jgi:hypothetical protein
MKKIKIKFEERYDFSLIGISSHVKIHKLCSALNNAFEYNFCRINDLEIKNKNSNNEEFISCFNLFFFENKEEQINYYLISNSSETGYLIPEEKKSDYFLLINGYIHKEDKEQIIDRINSAIPIVNLAYEIDINTLKSKKILFLLIE